MPLELDEVIYVAKRLKLGGYLPGAEMIGELPQPLEAALGELDDIGFSSNKYAFDISYGRHYLDAGSAGRYFP